MRSRKMQTSRLLLQKACFYMQTVHSDMQTVQWHVQLSHLHIQTVYSDMQTARWHMPLDRLHVRIGIGSPRYFQSPPPSAGLSASGFIRRNSTRRFTRASASVSSSFRGLKEP